MKKIILFALFAVLFASCKGARQNDSKVFTEIDATPQLAERAYRFAELYEQTETEYGLGAQDPVRRVRIDCSGLVVMCYKYAITDTKYQLLLPDMSSAYIYENASTHIEKNDLRKGDLIFMGQENSSYISHIALFDRIENGNIYFIDSTLKDTDGDGADDINGVTHRYYSQNDAHIKGFGMMRLKYEQIPSL